MMNFFDTHYERIYQAAAKVAGAQAWDVLLVSHRPFFDPEEFRTFRSGRIKSVTYVSDLDVLRSLDRRFDIAIVCNSTAQEHVPLFSIRHKAMADFIFIWTFDNHHAKWGTLAINTLGDAVIPVHAFDAAYMKSPATILGRHVPFGTGQWSRASAAQLFQDSMNESRLDSLQGSFVRHPGAGDARYKLANSLKDGIPGNAIEIVVDPASYFDKGPKER